MCADADQVLRRIPCIYKMVQHYAECVGVNIEGFGAHSLRATAATNALDHEADIAKVQV